MTDSRTSKEQLILAVSEAFHALMVGKKSFPTAHGQQLGCEQYSLRFSGAQYSAVVEAIGDLYGAVRNTIEPCVCGSPTTLGTVHRTDGPCYVADSAHEPPAVRQPDKFDLAFEIMRQLKAEEMETMQSCQFGYVMRVTREGATQLPPPEQGSDFDQDLAVVNAIRNGVQVSESNRILLSFIDKLWREYTRTLVAAEPPADEAIEHAIRRIQECELSMDDSEGLVVMLTELKQRRAAQPPTSEPRVECRCDHCGRESFEVRMIGKPCGAMLDAVCPGYMRAALPPIRVQIGPPSDAPRVYTADPDTDALRDALTALHVRPALPPAVPHSADHLQRFTDWLVKEMPAGTVIGDPAWWARKLLAAACVFADEASDSWHPVMLSKPTKDDGDVVLVFTGEAYSVEYPEDVNGAEHIAWCRINPYSRPTKESAP